MTELRDGMMFELIVGGCGEYRQQFERFEDAARECDRLNRRDEFVALARDAAGVVVRDHTAAAVWQ
ncbi:MAG: hypothetical protein ACXWI8_13595 [Burkholderiales bacterium]